jgi:16S rRNA C967 or C1407 C5-methylase (RsmB/RsmF family)
MKKRRAPHGGGGSKLGKKRGPKPFGRPRTEAGERPARVHFKGRPGRVRPVERPSRDERDDEEAPEPIKPASEKVVLQKFGELWKSLFSSPVHLDSALSKLPRNLKTTLAQIVPQILLRPVSQAEMYGIGVAPEEPWSLPSAQLAQWRPAQVLAQRLYGSMSHRASAPDPQPADFPPRLTEEWEKSWGREAMLELVGALGCEAPLSLRAARKVGAQALLDHLTAGSRLPVKAELSGLSPLGVRLAGYAPVLGSELYAQGGFEIQDEGSQLMALFALWPERFAPLLQKRPGPAKDGPAIALPEQEAPAWTVVDACAGAGGKSLALADAMAGKGRVFAYDVSATKLQALRRRATHAGLNNIQSVALKEGHEDEVIGKFRRRAHVVLVDAPCSGWGVLRRNPDIKWRQEPGALERLPEIQLRLLSQYSQLVAGQGRLIYGTCTFREAETRGLVERFLLAHPEFEAREGGYLGPGPCDGFFMQCFVRKGNR